MLREHGVAHPHTADDKAPSVETQRRYRSTDKNNVAMYANHNGGYDYGKKVHTRPCLKCSAPVEVSGTSVWWGLGCWSSLNGCTDDFPAKLRNMLPADEECE